MYISNSAICNDLRNFVIELNSFFSIVNFLMSINEISVYTNIYKDYLWQEYESEIFVTDQQALDIYEDMKKIYGDALPHPDHHPTLFTYYVKLYRYYHQATPIWNIIQESYHLIW